MRARDHPLEDLHAAPPQLLVERDLGLHDGDPLGEPIDDCEQEVLHGRSRLRVAGLHAPAPEEPGNPVEMGVETDAQRVTERTDPLDQRVREVEAASGRHAGSLACSAGHGPGATRGRRRSTSRRRVTILP